MNKLRTEIEEDEAEKQLVVEEKPVTGNTRQFIFPIFYKRNFQC